MKLSISNLAFKNQPLDSVLGCCVRQGIVGLELAPGVISEAIPRCLHRGYRISGMKLFLKKFHFDTPLLAAESFIWQEPLISSVSERREIRHKVEQAGLKVAALQSVFFGRPDLQLFGSAADRKNMQEYLKGIIDLCHDLGAGIMCFGAYRNRKKGELEFCQAFDIAADFFRSLAEDAKQADVVICFEPLSKQYGCDFIQTASEGAELVERVGQKHFQLVFDVGNAMMDDLDPQEEIENHSACIYHIHLNRPRLQAPGKEEQVAIKDILESVGYSGYLTLEFLSEHLFFDEELKAVISYYL